MIFGLVATRYQSMQHSLPIIYGSLNA